MNRIITTFEQAQIGATHIIDHCNNGVKFVGLDTETTINRPIDKDLVSTIQVSYIINGKQMSYIFQIYKIWRISKAFPPLLKKVIQSNSIIKVGVDIITDMNRIKSSYGITAKGYLDIQPIAQTLNIPCSSLNDLCQKFIPEYNSKDPLGHEGNWDGDLTDSQILYGIRDAYYSYLLYGKIMNLKVDEVHVNKDDNLEILCTWIKTSMKTSTKDRTIASVVNQISNSYKPWANKYTKMEMSQMADEMIREMGEKGMLKLDDKYIVADRPDIMTIDLDPKTINDIKELNYHAASNKLFNSYGPIQNYPKSERNKWIAARLNNLQP